VRSERLREYRPRRDLFFFANRGRAEFLDFQIPRAKFADGNRDGWPYWSTPLEAAAALAYVI